MLVLDTDHLTEFQKGVSPEAHRLKHRLDEANERYATSIITVEESMRGWMAAIRRTVDPRQQVKGYARLQLLFRFFATWEILPWNEAHAANSKPGGFQKGPGTATRQLAVLKRPGEHPVRGHGGRGRLVKEAAAAPLEGPRAPRGWRPAE